MLNPDLTVIYYTNNKEYPQLEENAKKHISSLIADTPLISVSQKPIDFGHNICVGDVGTSSQNAFRQMQIGAKAAKTKFVCPAEADYFHPKEYFEFVPPREDTFYIGTPLWVLINQRGKARVFLRKPRGSEAFMVVGRELLIDRLEQILASRGMWGIADADGKRLPYLLAARQVKRQYFELPRPAVTFKTTRNMHRRTPHDSSSKTRELPGWGTAADVIKRYMG